MCIFLPIRHCEFLAVTDGEEELGFSHKLWVGGGLGKGEQNEVHPDSKYQRYTHATGSCDALIEGIITGFEQPGAQRNPSPVPKHHNTEGFSQWERLPTASLLNDHLICLVNRRAVTHTPLTSFWLFYLLPLYLLHISLYYPISQPRSFLILQTESKQNILTD